MKREGYIEAVKKSLLASYFDETKPGSLIGVSSKKSLFGLTLWENSARADYLAQFTAFHQHERESWWKSDTCEYILIFEPDIQSTEFDNGEVELLKDIITNVTQHSMGTYSDDTEKVFIYLLFITEDASSVIKKAISNGAHSEWPHFAVLPVLADVSNASLSFRTEKLERGGITGRPFIPHMADQAEEYFTVEQ